MYELVNTYSDAFTKPSKPIGRVIKHKIELIDPKNRIPHHKLQRINEGKLQEVHNHLQECLEKG